MIPSRVSSLAGCAFVAALLAAKHAPAQQVTIQTPLRSASDGFFEQIGGSWGINGRNWFFRFGGGPAVPPFGNPNPGAGAGFGAGFGGGGINGGFSFMAAQGSRRSNIMQSGNLTVTNGVPGFVGDTSISPFVIGIIPVVGDARSVPWQQQYRGDIPKQTPGPVVVPLPEEADGAGPAPQVGPLAPRGGSDANASRSEFAADPGLRSVAELKQQRADVEQARTREIEEQLAKAREAEAAGKPSVARIFYQMAARRAQGEAKARIEADLLRLEARLKRKP